MRKVTDHTTRYFLSGKPLKIGNTSTDGNILYLHGNPIARHAGGRIEITLAGWDTPTTRERLNGLPGVHVTRRKGATYLNGVQWDGQWTVI